MALQLPDFSDWKSIQWRTSVENVGWLARKELKHYFNSPLAYIIIVTFLLISGWFFTYGLFLNNQATLRNFFSALPFILIFFVPAISMRLLAEEKKLGTLELLVTMPLRDEEIILGKFLGASAFYCVTLALTLIYPISIAFLGNLDWGPVVGGYLGLVLMGMGMLAIGLFTSSLTSNQIAAFIIAFGISFILFMLGKTVEFAPTILAGILDFLGFDSHFENISKGVIDSRDIIYYFSLIFLSLFLTGQSLENRKK